MLQLFTGGIMLAVDYNNKISIREAFGKKLASLGHKNPNIVVLDADLSCSTQTKFFAKEFPERFFNVGIAEQNLISTASGLAVEGKIPFAATFAVFATGRTYDQIRSSVCYQNANVKIIGTHGGITVGEDGATHQALEDISLMRGLPNMTVIVPADANECEQAIEFASTHNGPVYVRISRANTPVVYSDNYKFDPYKASVLKEGKDLTIISNGDILIEACKAVEVLAQKGINAELISMPVVKPIDMQSIINSARKTGKVFTVENHSIYGGLGSAVAEVLSENLPTKVIRIGMNDEFGQSGTPEELLKHYKLDAEGIVDRILSVK